MPFNRPCLMYNFEEYSDFEHLGQVRHFRLLKGSLGKYVLHMQFLAVV